MAPAAGASWKNGSSRCQGRSSSSAHPNRAASDASSSRFHSVNGCSVARSTSANVANSRSSSSSPGAQARARSGRGSRGRARPGCAGARARGGRSATSGPICFDGVPRRRGARRRRRSCAGSRRSRCRRPGDRRSRPRKLLKVDSTRVSSSTMARRRSGGTCCGHERVVEQVEPAAEQRVDARRRWQSRAARISANSVRVGEQRAAGELGVDAAPRRPAGDDSVFDCHHASASSSSSGRRRPSTRFDETSNGRCPCRGGVYGVGLLTSRWRPGRPARDGRVARRPSGPRNRWPPRHARSPLRRRPGAGGRARSPRVTARRRDWRAAPATGGCRACRRSRSSDRPRRRRGSASSSPNAADDLVEGEDARDPRRQRDARPRVEHLGARLGAHATHVGDEVLGAEVARGHRRARGTRAPRRRRARSRRRRRRAGGSSPASRRARSTRSTSFGRLDLRDDDAGERGRAPLGDVGREPLGRDRVHAHVDRE